MNTSEYNESLQPGETPVGPTPKRTNAPASEQPQQQTTKPMSRGEFMARQRGGTPPPPLEDYDVGIGVDNVVEQLRRARTAAGITGPRLREGAWYEARQRQEGNTSPQPVASRPQPPAAPTSTEPGGLNTVDLWDEGYVAPEAEVGSFDQYRSSRGHSIEVPPGLATDTRHSEEDIASAVRDAGVAMAHAGIPQETAQALFNVVAEGYEAPSTEEGFTIDRGLSAIRVIAGKDTDKIVEQAQRYVQGKPALAAWLDESTLGSHPQVVLALAVLQSRPSLATKAGAEAYLAELKKPSSAVSKKYLAGDKLEVHAARIAFAVASGGK